MSYKKKLFIAIILNLTMFVFGFKTLSKAIDAQSNVKIILSSIASICFLILLIVAILKFKKSNS